MRKTSLAKALLEPCVLAFAALSIPSGALGQLNSLSKDELIKITAPNPFERFGDGRPKVPNSILEKVRDMSAEEVLGIARKGYPGQFVGDMKILTPGKTLVGRAFTLQLMPARSGTGPEFEIGRDRGQRSGTGPELVGRPLSGRFRTAQNVLQPAAMGFPETGFSPLHERRRIPNPRPLLSPSTNPSPSLSRSPRTPNIWSRAVFLNQKNAAPAEPARERPGFFTKQTQCRYARVRRHPEVRMPNPGVSNQQTEFESDSSRHHRA